ncbi:MAG: hypothetical protein RML40_10895 [Bacteroidota bacterium]|nr:hypothetical protein [Candidatus Kapabacteria bacterium]MDW8221021.1 hypothetical protein [Bacteroidota bacterium]
MKTLQASASVHNALSYLLHAWTLIQESYANSGINGQTFSVRSFARMLSERCPNAHRAFIIQEISRFNKTVALLAKAVGVPTAKNRVSRHMLNKPVQLGEYNNHILTACWIISKYTGDYTLILS